MIKLFRNIRLSLLKEGKTSKYFKYAIGEIVLVVIGILIALQINNWNQNRQQRAQLNTILKSVREDLKTDTLMASQVIRFYDTINKYSKKLISKDFTIDSLENCLSCGSLVTVYQPMTIQKKGFKQLQNFTDINTLKIDTLTSSINLFYTVFDELIYNNNQMVKKEVIENLDHFKKQDWFINWMQGIKDPRVSEYFGNSQDYKNRVASHNILAAKNHQRMLQVYKTQASMLLDQLNSRLDIEAKKE